MATIVKITLMEGGIISGRADFGRGSPSDPIRYDEVAETFRGCAAFAEWPSSKANQVIDQVIDMVRRLEDFIGRPYSDGSPAINRLCMNKTLGR